MKRVILLLLAVCGLTLLVFSALSSGARRSNRRTTLLAGAGEILITGVKDRPEVYQDLYARALVVGRGDERLAVVTLDLGTISYAFAEVALAAISEATDIPTENILICTSQTHSAPGVDGRYLSPESAQWLTGALAKLVAGADADLKPATLRVGRSPVQIGYNRRLMKNGQIVMEPNPDGAVVPWVDSLSAYDADDELIGVLFSHAAHPVIVHWALRDMIGPDFPGYAVKHLNNLLGEKGESDGVFMFAQGSCGNINGYPLRGGLAAADAAGLSLAVAVTQALAADEAVTAGPIRSRSLTLSLPRRPPPSATECKKVLAAEPDNLRYQALLKLAESGETAYMDFPMQAIAIGDDVCILTVTGELFAEYQLWVDEASPFARTFVFNHVNGISGYIATKADYDLGPAGGYEAWDGPTRGHSMPLAPSTEQTVRDGMLQLLNDLKRAGD